MSRVALPVLTVFTVILSLIGLPSPACHGQTPSCIQAFSVGPDQVLCDPDTQTLVTLNTDWEVLQLDWLVDPSATSFLDSTMVEVTTSSQTSLIAQAEIRSPELVVNGDFSMGNTGFTSTLLYNFFTLLIPASYNVIPNPEAYHPDFQPCDDHTTGGGAMFAANGNILPNRNVWCQNIAVEPGGVYDISFWASALTENELPELVIRLDGQNVLPSSPLGPAPCTWVETATTWTAGFQTSVQFCIRNLQGSNSGNDFALDDISMRERCQITDTVQVVHQPAQLTVVDTLLCPGDTLWVAGQPFTNTQSDTLVIADSRGCDSTILVDLRVLPDGLQTTLPDTLNCNRDSVTLSADWPGIPPGEVSWFWTSPGGTPLLVDTGSIQVSNPGVYSLTANTSMDWGGCAVTTNWTVLQDTMTPVANAGTDQTLTCLVDSVTIGGIGTSAGSNYTILWMGSPTGPGPGTGSVTQVDYTGEFVLMVEDRRNGCRASDTVVVVDGRVIPGGLTAVLQVPVCIPNNGQVSVVSMQTGTPPFTYVVRQNGVAQSGSGSFSGLMSGPLDLQVADANGCVWDTSLIVPPSLPLLVTLPDDLTAEAGESLPIIPQLSFPDSLVVSSFWSSGLLQIDCPNCPVTDVFGLTSDTILFCVTLAQGCVRCARTAVAIQQPQFVFVPTAFSPDGNGLNDLFSPQGNPVAVAGYDRMQIFDRWGGQVFDWQGSPGNIPAWDGEWRSKLMDPGVYIWTLEYTLIDGRRVQAHGEVQLMR